jgi:predicted XRE-type DNA-binding protein
MNTQQRAARQRTMMALRQWMELNDVSRGVVAAEMGITKGHLSTLLNANRTPSEAQVQKAKEIMGDVGPAPAGVPIMEHKKVSMNMLARSKPKGATKKPKLVPKKTPKPHNLRPMTKFEADFVATVAKAWIHANKGASQDEFVEIVRALSIGIRS